MKTILVPSDLSKNADNALRYAIQLSRFLKSGLLLFHCTQLPAYIFSAVSAEEQLKTLISEDIEFKRKKLQLQAARAYKQLGYLKVPASAKVIVESNPLLVENILEAAEKNHASLIIMGTHGATGLNRFFFGSNTAELIAKSTVPVLAIPERYRYVPVKEIVFSSDLEFLAGELKRVLPYASAVKASVKVLYLDYGLDISKAQAQKTNTIIKKCGYRKIALVNRKATIEFSLNRQIQQFLDQHKSQWLVMFTKERSFWNKVLYGGKTEKMSYSLKVPLLSFRK